MNQKQELVLKILSSVDVIEGKTKFVKILHLVCKLFEKNQKESPFAFMPDRYGVNSPELQPILQNLEDQGILKINKSFFSKRNDLSLVDRNFVFKDKIILEMGPKIGFLVQALNQYSGDEVIAISYDLFPETTTKSEIKPKVNKITGMFSPLSSDFEESFEEGTSAEPIGSNVKSLYPQFNDLDVRMNMMKSLGLENLPSIVPSVIDESSGLVAKETLFLKKYDFEKLLEDARRR